MARCKNMDCQNGSLKCPGLDDRLFCMFNRQIEFQMLNANGEMPRLDGELVAQFSLGIITELGEVLQEYKGWKPWKNSDNYTYNKEKVEEELADLWHHMINLTLSLGYNHHEVYELFDVKHDTLLDERFPEEDK